MIANHRYDKSLPLSINISGSIYVPINNFNTGKNQQNPLMSKGNQVWHAAMGNLYLKTYHTSEF